MDPLRTKTDPVSVPDVEILHASENSSAWSIFHRIRYRVRQPGKAPVEGEREFLDRGDAVALLPYCSETGTVLLTRQFRMPVYLKQPHEAMLVEVCGGILDDTNPEVTIRHEARDEIGLEIHDLKHIFDAYSTPGSVCEKVHYFLAPYTSPQRRYPGGGNTGEGEEVEILEVRFAEALRMVRDRRILDARTIALLMYLAAFPPANFAWNGQPEEGDA